MAPEDGITEHWEFISPVTQKAIIPHPTGRTIQSITVISFDPLTTACLCQHSNKFNLYHTLIEGITNREGLSKNLLMKCYYTEWIIEMGKDSLSNLVTARACTVPKSISYSNKEEWGGKHKQGRKLNEELHMPSTLTVTVFSDWLNGLQIDLQLRAGYLNYPELNVDIYVYLWLIAI